MRELTEAEIDQFDFTGHVPELHVATVGVMKRAVVSTTQSRASVKLRPLAKRPSNARRSRFGTPRTA